MKRFVVFVEFVDPDQPDQMAQEAVQDFDTFDEAVDFISQQFNPNSYVIDDTDAEDLDEEEPVGGRLIFVDGSDPDGSLTTALRQELDKLHGNPTWITNISDRDTGDEVEYDDDDSPYEGVLRQLDDDEEDEDELFH